MRLLVSFLLLWAQSAAQDITFKSKTELVQVPVVVTRDGKHVPGLTRDAFTLLLDGHAETVAVFEEVQALPAGFESEVLPTRTMQNYAKTGDHRQDIVIIVLDYVNASWSSSARMRSYLGDMSKSLADAKLPFAVLLQTRNGLVQAHSFTSDPQNLIKAIDRLAKTQLFPAVQLDQINLGWSNALTPVGFTSSLETLQEGARGFSGSCDVASNLASAEQIAQAFRGIPGRKKLVWMSLCFAGSFSNTGPSGRESSAVFQNADRVSRALKAFADANFAVYPVDSNGVVNPTWNEQFSAEHGAKPFVTLEPSAFKEIPTDTAGLMRLAQTTGGQLCTDLPTVCIKRIQQDGNYYVLGFYLDKDSREGWHQVKIKVNQPSVSVRARDGFWVGSRKGPLDNQVARATVKIRPAAAGLAVPKSAAGDEVLTAILAPLDYSGIPLRLSWSEISAAGGRRQIELRVTSPPGGILIDGDTKTMNVDYLAFLRPLGHSEGESFPASLVKQLSPAQIQSMAAQGFLYRKAIAIAPGRYQLRVLVRDNVAGKIGTVSTVLDLTEGE